MYIIITDISQRPTGLDLKTHCSHHEGLVDIGLKIYDPGCNRKRSAKHDYDTFSGKNETR